MALQPNSDEYYMKEALKEAKKALELDEVPVGAVIVCNNQIIARAHNFTERLNDVTAHAEMQAFTSAADYLGGKVSQRMYAVCYIRTLFDVCWSKLLGTNKKDSFWCF